MVLSRSFFFFGLVNGKCNWPSDSDDYKLLAFHQCGFEFGPKL
jgi:hypothetical protein